VRRPSVSLPSLVVQSRAFCSITASTTLANMLAPRPCLPLCGRHCRCCYHAGVFDVKAVRRALETRVRALEAEKQQVRAHADGH
jgi:hypothetical protein